MLGLATQQLGDALDTPISPSRLVAQLARRPRLDLTGDADVDHADGVGGRIDGVEPVDGDEERRVEPEGEGAEDGRNRCR